VHVSTGYTPFFLEHGREARLPLEVLEGQTQDLTDDYEQYQTRLTLSLKEAYMAVQRTLKQVAKTTKARWDAHVRPSVRFIEGQTVMMYLPKINSQGPAHSAKLQPDWQGPYVVLDAAADSNVYRIRDARPGRNYELTVNGANLKPLPAAPQASLTENPSPVSGKRQFVDEVDNSPPPPDSRPTTRRRTTVKEKQREKERATIRYQQRTEQPPDEFQEVPIDKILSHKRKGNNRYTYLIKWENRPGHDSWVNSRDIYTADCLREYWTSLNIPIGQVPRQFRQAVQEARQVQAA
jgi:hypothetical protein